MNTTTKPRRSGAKIMAQLIVLLGSLVYIMLLAVINGTAGFLCAMGVTLSGAAAIAKALGEEISLSYGALIALAVGCGVLRGLLRVWPSSTATTTLPSVCWRCCATRSSRRCAVSARPSWKPGRRAPLLR